VSCGFFGAALFSFANLVAGFKIICLISFRAETAAKLCRQRAERSLMLASAFSQMSFFLK